jgi:hypothetical protein
MNRMRRKEHDKKEEKENVTKKTRMEEQRRIN